MQVERLGEDGGEAGEGEEAEDPRAGHGADPAGDFHGEGLVQPGVGVVYGQVVDRAQVDWQAVPGMAVMRFMLAYGQPPVGSGKSAGAEREDDRENQEHEPGGGEHA